MRSAACFSTTAFASALTEELAPPDHTCLPAAPRVLLTASPFHHAGIYPFAGKEVARAFALISTDVKDCCADLAGLGPVELDALREWEAKFNSKYPIVGKLVQQ